MNNLKKIKMYVNSALTIIEAAAKRKIDYAGTMEDFEIVNNRIFEMTHDVSEGDYPQFHEES